MKELPNLSNNAIQLTDQYLSSAIQLCHKYNLELSTNNLSMVLHWLGYFQQNLITMSLEDMLHAATTPDQSDGEDAITLK